MKYLFYIFKINIIRYFNFSLPAELADHQSAAPSFCSSVIAATVEKKGRRWLFAANLALFFLGLLLTIAADAAEALSDSYLLAAILSALITVFFIFKFDAWRISESKNLLKLFFILSMLIYDGYSSITYVFLIIYENMVALSAIGGI